MKQQFIPGIYNYCDRWCERCIFTSRCRNYENTGKLSAEQLDIHNKAFWNNIASNFENAIKLLHKAAEKQGIDVDQPMKETDNEVYREKQSFINASAKNHTLSKRCKQYQKLVLPYLKQTDAQLTENGYPKDSDGSAKNALIVVEKSMAAWFRLYELLPACEDVALKVLALLQQLQQQINTTFPKAMQFKKTWI